MSIMQPTPEENWKGAVRIPVQCARTTDKLDISEPVGDEVLVKAADMITNKIREILDLAKVGEIQVSGFEVRWFNIMDRETNPDGRLGHFYILGTGDRHNEQ